MTCRREEPFRGPGSQEQKPPSPEVEQPAIKAPHSRVQGERAWGAPGGLALPQFQSLHGWRQKPPSLNNQQTKAANPTLSADLPCDPTQILGALWASLPLWPWRVTKEAFHALSPTCLMSATHSPPSVNQWAECAGAGQDRARYSSEEDYDQGTY